MLTLTKPLLSPLTVFVFSWLMHIDLLFSMVLHHNVINANSAFTMTSCFSPFASLQKQFHHSTVLHYGVDKLMLPHWCHQLIVVIDIFFLSMLMLPPVLLHNFLLLCLHIYHCHCSQWCTIMLLIAIRPLVCHSYCHHLPCHAMMLLSMMLPDFSASFSSFAESAVKLVPSPLVDCYMHHSCCYCLLCCNSQPDVNCHCSWTSKSPWPLLSMVHLSLVVCVGTPLECCWRKPLVRPDHYLYSNISKISSWPKNSSLPWYHPSWWHPRINQ